MPVHPSRKYGLAGSFIGIAAVVRFILPLLNNPLTFVWIGAPMVQWRSATAPLDMNPLTVIDPFLYPAWLGLIAKLTLGDATAIGVYSGLLSALTPWVWYRFLREALPSKGTALAGACVLAWLPSWIGLFDYLLPETLLLPLTGLSLWMTWRSQRKKTLESFVWASVCWMTACLTKMTVAPLAVLSLGWLLRSQSPRLPRVGAALTLLVLCVVTLGYRSYKVIGVWAPFGYPMHNRIYMASGAETLHLSILRQGVTFEDDRFTSGSMRVLPFEPLSNWRTSRTGVCDVSVDLSHGTRDWNTALQTVQVPFRRRVHLQMENMIFALWGPSWPDNAGRLWERLSYQNRWIWAPLLCVVLGMNVVFFRRTKSIPMLPLLTMIGWFLILFQPVSPSEGRYRKPFEGLLIANALWLKGRKAKAGVRA